MTYNELAHECRCSKCGWEWRARTASKPAVCPHCTSRNWDEKGSRKFDCIISKILPGEAGQHKFGIIPFVDKPSVESTDTFSITVEDYNKYFYGMLARTRCKINSAIVLIGDFELREDLILKINECKLIYAHSQGMGREYVDDACIYNIKSFYEQQKAEQLRKLEAERQAALEEERQQKRLAAAKIKLEKESERQAAIAAAKKTVEDPDSSMEDKMKAVIFLEQV